MYEQNIRSGLALVTSITAHTGVFEDRSIHTGHAARYEIPEANYILRPNVLDPAECRLEVLKDEVNNVLLLHWCKEYEIL